MGFLDNLSLTGTLVNRLGLRTTAQRGAAPAGLMHISHDSSVALCGHSLDNGGGDRLADYCPSCIAANGGKP